MFYCAKLYRINLLGKKKLSYLNGIKSVQPVARKLHFNKRVICSAENLVKGGNTTLHLFYALAAWLMAQPGSHII